MIEECEFPLDMIYTPSGIVVRMESKQGNSGTGTVIGTGQKSSDFSGTSSHGGIYSIGYHSNLWGMDMFEPLHKKKG